MSMKVLHHHHRHHWLRRHRMSVTPLPWGEELILGGGLAPPSSPPPPPPPTPPSPTTTTTTTFFPPTPDLITILTNHHHQEQHHNYNNDDTIIAMVSTTTTTTFNGQRKAELATLGHFFTVWGVLVVLLSLAVVTLVANSTILTMFVLRKSVRKCKNIYIASLAAADLGIGLTVPVAALEQVESEWVLGGVACHLYQTVRCSLLYVSLLSILLITVDRWWSIHYPFTYRARQSKRLAAVAVAIVWIISFALHVPPVLLWDLIFGDDVRGSDVMGGGAAAKVGRGTLLSVLDASIPSISSSSSSSSSLSSSPSPFLSMVMTTMSPPGTMSSEQSEVPVYHTSDNHLHLKQNFKEDSSSQAVHRLHAPSVVSDGKHCELPYADHFSFVLTSSVVLYIVPLLALWVLNCSLYFKITRRKSIKIRRSLSVNDNYLLTFRKSSSESESSPNNGDGHDDSIRGAEQRQRLLAAARAGRRHTLAFPFPGTHPKFGAGGGGAGSGAGSIYYPSQNVPRQHMARRVSMQEAFTGIGSMAALAGAIPNLPRVTSCGRFNSNGRGSGYSSSMIPMGLWFGSGHRQNSCSSRKQSEDLVKELLVRQDKKAARLLGLLVTVFTICWLPYTVVSVLKASHPDTVLWWTRDLVVWILLTNSAINPFLYGLLNAEFRKILRGWFYFRRDINYRLKHALLYWSLPPHGDSDGVKDNQGAHRFATSIKE